MVFQSHQKIAQRQWIIFGIYCWGMLNEGLFISSLGPILPNLMDQINVSLATASILFSAQTFGFVFGSVWGGYVLDVYTNYLFSPKNGTTYLIKRNQTVNDFLYSLPKWSWWPLSAHNMFSISLIVSGITTALIPFVSNVWSLGTLVIINGICFGNINTFGNILLLILFDVEMRGDIDFDRIYASVERLSANPTCDREIDASHEVIEMTETAGVFTTSYGSTQPADSKMIQAKDDNSKDQLVGPFMQSLLGLYALGGLLGPVLIQLSIDLTGDYYPSFWLFTMLYIPPGVILFFYPQPVRMSVVCQRLKEIEKATKIRSQSDDIVVELKSENRQFWSKCLIAGTAIGLFIYSGAQLGFGAYVTTYSTNYLHTALSTGRFLASANWAGMFVGRCIAVPLSNKMSALNMIRLNLVFFTVGSILLFYSRDATDISWIASVLVGFGLCTLWPSTFVWVETLIPLTGMNASIIVGISSIGLCVIPATLGTVMAAMGAGSFTDIMLILSILMMMNHAVNSAIAKKLIY